MSDEEFCGTICMAAKKLAIRAGFHGRQLVWMDPMTGENIVCKPGATKKEALKNGCEELVNYLSIKR